MRKIRQVLEYRLGNKLSADKTAQVLSLSKGTVIGICQRFTASGLPWPLSDTCTDTELEQKLFPQKPVVVAGDTVPVPDLAYIERERMRPRVSLQRLWEEYNALHPDAMSRASFYRYVNKNRPVKVTMHMIHKGGDKLYVDYSGDSLSYIDRDTGEIVDVELFVCAWGASSYAYAEATLSQKKSDFIGSHVRAFNFFGYIPQALVPDNLKSAVTKSKRFDPILNLLYSEMARHYATAILPARVCALQDKAIVESAVQQAQNFILANLRNRTFYSLTDINRAITEELDKLNHRPMKDYGGMSRLERFEACDKPFAQPRPREPFRVSIIRHNVRVARNYHVQFEKHFYSVSYKLAGQLVDVHLNGHTVEIYHNGMHCCRHLAQPSNYGYTTVEAHMPPEHAFVKGWRPDYFLAKAGEIGPSAAAFVEAIFKKAAHPEQGFNVAQALLRYAKTYSNTRVENACARAVHFKMITSHAIKSIIESGLDDPVKHPIISPVARPATIEHENIRRAQYYNL
jgi:transposase